MSKKNKKKSFSIPLKVYIVPLYQSCRISVYFKNTPVFSREFQDHLLSNIPDTLGIEARLTGVYKENTYEIINLKAEKITVYTIPTVSKKFSPPARFRLVADNKKILSFIEVARHLFGILQTEKGVI